LYIYLEDLRGGQINDKNMIAKNTIFDVLVLYDS